MPAVYPVIPKALAARQYSIIQQVDMKGLHYEAESPSNSGDVNLSKERPVEWVVWVIGHHSVADGGAKFHGLRNWLLVKGGNCIGMLHLVFLTICGFVKELEHLSNMMDKF